MAAQTAMSDLVAEGEPVRVRMAVHEKASRLFVDATTQASPRASCVRLDGSRLTSLPGQTEQPEVDGFRSIADLSSLIVPEPNRDLGGLHGLTSHDLQLSVDLGQKQAGGPTTPSSSRYQHGSG